MIEQFFFAYAQPGEAFDPVAHAVNDEDVVSLDISQNEGDFANLTVVIRNPRVGLLFGRLWCFLSGDDGSGVPTLQFYGRIVGAPKRIGGDDDRIEVQFTARPDDYTARKIALAQVLMVLPFYDPIFDSTSNGQPINPDSVLEGYSALWHTDRVTLALTISDIITGEDGILEFGEDTLIHDALSVSYGHPPLYQINVTVTGDWTQGASNGIDLTAMILSAFGRARSQPYGGNTFSTLTADGLLSEWPKPNGNLGGGWQLTADSDIRAIAFNPPQHFTPNFQDISVTAFRPEVSPQKVVVHYQQRQPTPPGTSLSLAQNLILPYDEVHADFAVHTNRLSKFAITIAKATARSEQLSFVLVADVQQTENGVDPDTLSLSAHLDDQIDFNTLGSPTSPIQDPARTTYFATDRGLLTFEHVVLRARAKLRDRARCVSCTFEVPWDVAQSVTCRMSATITDRRLPGGTATGKVTAYSLSASADGGQIANITIGCAVGNGGSVTAVAGDASYIEEDYIDPAYQIFSGNQIDLGVASDQVTLNPITGEPIPIAALGIPTPAPGEVWFEDLASVPVTAGSINLQSATADQIASCVVKNGFEAQATAAIQESTRLGASDPIGVIKGIPTIMTLQLLDLTNQNFHTQFTPTISQLKIPKGIDLAAGPQA